ncbi:DEAD-box ATP-dependent RNA helicase 24 isoform X2 [Olea europaea subsp. europaea]|uniref:DEAD-box ATP-dependent RNA helicase 24 isoform X2 n=1 Tax=Olea europaea subsp. europaea TaxID=158383 RepID=A0A8S0T6G6_OLEEU|nr:DEAD-box ATP-dependent RNA helicase 24 isoform X2 [Olea europaea subsp. europaea]
MIVASVLGGVARDNSAISAVVEVNLSFNGGGGFRDFVVVLTVVLVVVLCWLMMFGAIVVAMAAVVVMYGAMVVVCGATVVCGAVLLVDEVESQLSQRGLRVAALHGDKDQASRMEILQKFKSGTYHVLIATDVAARGLDIKSIKSVVNFDIAKDMDMHVHRIGRTGRAGDKDGTAYTLITEKEARFAGELVNSLIAAGQNATMELMDLAMKVGKELKGGAEVVTEVCEAWILDWVLGIVQNPMQHQIPFQVVRPPQLIH